VAVTAWRDARVRGIGSAQTAERPRRLLGHPVCASRAAGERACAACLVGGPAKDPPLPCAGKSHARLDVGGERKPGQSARPRGQAPPADPTATSSAETTGLPLEKHSRDRGRTGDSDWAVATVAPSLLDHRFRASTITSSVGTNPYRRSARSRSPAVASPRESVISSPSADALLQVVLKGSDRPCRSGRHQDVRIAHVGEVAKRRYRAGLPQT
jgi:hypothetical protein